MKDYSISKEDAKTFVLKYEINKEGNLITVYLASKQTVTIPYSVENEKKILEKMKTQILEREYNPYTPISIALLSSSYVALSIASLIAETDPINCLKMAALAGLIGSVGIIDILVNKKIEKDFNKNKIFVLNEDKIRDYLSYIKSDTKITINDLDNFNYKEIAKLVDDAKVISELVAKTHIKK